MAIERYLAMTGAEMASAAALPKKTAWMACHFSPYSTGLCNFPAALPKESLLILNDRTPISGHDPERVCRELKETISKLNCTGLLVDFLNPPNRESLALTSYLAANLPRLPGASAGIRRRGLRRFCAGCANPHSGFAISVPLAGAGNLAGAGAERTGSCAESRRRTLRRKPISPEGHHSHR